MFCRNCGAQLEENARFCPSCGAPVGQAQQPRVQQPQYTQVQQPQYTQPQVGQTYQQPTSTRRSTSTGGTDRKIKISATPEFRVLGIPVSGKTALIVIGVVVVLVLIAKLIGG